MRQKQSPEELTPLEFLVLIPIMMGPLLVLLSLEALVLLGREAFGWFAVSGAKVLVAGLGIGLGLGLSLLAAMAIQVLVGALFAFLRDLYAPVIPCLVFWVGVSLPDGFLGDLEECHEVWVKMYGYRRARLLLVRQIGLSIWPLLCGYAFRLVLQFFPPPPIR